MRQEEIEMLLKKIEKSAQDVPVPEGLEPEQMMKKLEAASENHKTNPNPDYYRRKWKRPAEYAAAAALAVITILAAVQMQNAKITAEPGRVNETATEAAAPAGSEDPEPGDKELRNPEAEKYAAESYKEIYKKIIVYSQNNDYAWSGGAEVAAGAAPMDRGGTGVDEKRQESGLVNKNETVSTGTNHTSKEFSDTNVQVEGVDEGDIVKTDGTYLYIMSSDSGRIQIVEANKSSPQKRGFIADTSTTRESRSIQEFYINGDKLSVIRHAYRTHEEVPAKSVTYLETYDISDRDNPKLLGTVTQDGTYKSSRRVDDYIYLFTSYYACDFKNVKKTEGYIPAVNGKVLPYDSIYIPETVDGTGYIVTSAVDMKNPSQTTDEKAVLADGETFYVSSSNIYIGSSRFDGKADQYDYTELMKLSYKSGRITFKAHGNVDGNLNDQFSMDEYQGKLRLVSTLSYNSGTSTNSLLVLDENLKIIGGIEDLAPGEQIYSARFMNDMGYFVTFRNMDPLFSVDLTNPKDPKILGELKITGFSEYLHPYDGNLLLGIGQEISPDTGNFKGLKLSMFDISNPKDVTETEKTVIKAYEYSPAWDNHKAVAISSGKNVIGFAVEEYDKTSRNWNYKYVVYSYMKNQGFKEVLSFKLRDETNYGNTRGLYIGQYFYVVESSRVTVFDMKNFVQTGQVKY